MFGKAYCINYHTNCDLVIESIQLKAKKPMPSLPVLEKEGYKFIGWFLDSEYSCEYNLEVMPKANVELYAKWEAITLEEFLKDINFFTKSSNILKTLQNDYEGVPDFKDPKPEGEEKKTKKTTKKSQTKKTTKKTTTKKAKKTVKEKEIKEEIIENNEQVEKQVEEVKEEA